MMLLWGLHVLHMVQKMISVDFRISSFCLLDQNIRDFMYSKVEKVSNTFWRRRIYSTNMGAISLKSQISKF